MIVKIYNKPKRREWQQIMSRATASTSADTAEIVKGIIENVARNGDKALFDYEILFDHTSLSTLKVSPEEIEETEKLVPTELKEAIATAAQNIVKFHSAQIHGNVETETMPGVKCSQRAVPIEKIGMYIPGGNAPLFSTVLMLALPAKIAGCSQRILCTPPDSNGKINPAILYAAKIAGVEEIYKSGGAQAIAAMALGTESIPKVSKIFGPGNRFVMEAKQQITRLGTAIDMPAGPSEVMVIADENANLDFVAWHFLSQAEHGPDSQSIAIVPTIETAHALDKAIERNIGQLPDTKMVLSSLSHSAIVVLDNNERMEFANEYAPEHLIINTADADTLAYQVTNAGSVFIGAFSPESAGDYASGTNHTLPTSGYAKCYSGVNIDSFLRKITFQRISPEGLLNIGNTITVMARNEKLTAHSRAVECRLNNLNK